MPASLGGGAVGLLSLLPAWKAASEATEALVALANYVQISGLDQLLIDLVKTA